MKTFLRSLAVLAVLALAPAAFAQQAVQQVPSRLDSCAPSSATGAINTVVTLTLTPPAGQYVYLCGLDVSTTNNSTGAVTQANVAWTSTGLGGWQYKYSSVNALNTTGNDKSFTWNPLIRSVTPGVAVVFTSPAINAQAQYTITAYYYFAP